MATPAGGIVCGLVVLLAALFLTPIFVGYLLIRTFLLNRTFFKNVRLGKNCTVKQMTDLDKCTAKQQMYG